MPKDPHSPPDVPRLDSKIGGSPLPPVGPLPDNGMGALDANFRKPLERYFRRQGLSEADAQDYTQETMTRIVGKGGVGSLANPQGYVFSVASNLLRDRARRRRTRAADAHVVVDSSDLVSDQPSAHRQLVAHQELARIREAILALPDKPRRVFVMHRFEGLTYPEIAELMGLSRSSVEKYMMTALGKLKDVRKKS
ncbi:MAG: RNA polymerase sigma factor [Litorimonas sp.]